MNNINNLGISMRNSADIQAHSISIIKDNRVVSLEDYITEIAGDGGGGGSGDGYTQAEVDALLNTKLNVSNPQDITGNLRLDPTNGNSKIILNAVTPSDANVDFYCNGNAHINGSLRVSILTSDGDVNCDGVNADTFNSNVITNDIIFKHNDIEYMRFNVDDNVIDLSTDLDLQTSELMCNNFNCSYLNDVVFKIMADEYLRFQISDNTVRVPNTRSFLSQNIYTNIIRPIAYGNDLICYGSNAADTGYIEYWKLNHAAETIDISNVLRVNEINTLTDTDLIIKRYGVQRLSITSTYTEFTGAVHCGNQLVVDTAKKLTMAPYAFGGINHFDIRNNHTANPMIRFRCGLTGEITCMELTTSYVNLKKDLTIENTVRLKSNTIDTNDDNNLVFNRNNVEYFRLTTVESVDSIDFIKLLRANAQIRVNNLQINQFSSGVQYADFRLENADSVMRFYVGNSTSANFQITNAGITLGRETTISSVKTNTINSNGNATLNIQQNGNSFISLLGDALNRVQVNRFLRVVDVGESTQAQFVNNSNGNYMEFRLGNHINAYSSGTPVNGNVLHLNYYSHGNVMLGTNQDTTPDPIPTISINKFSSGTGNAFEVQGNSVFSGTVSTNTLNSESGDLTIQRDGTDVLNIFSYTPTNGPSIIVDAQSDCGISSSWLFANTFANRTGNTDTEFRGAIAGGLSSGKVYMTYLHATETLDFDCIIDNTGQNVIGNLINTAVSDKNLKTNIQDIDANCSDCVKNVKLKTFEFKDKKYHNQDKYGMIAQDLQEHLPNEFKGIVRENKPKKDEDKEYLSIDYMKLSIILWGCLQEEMKKREHIESRLFELEDIVREMRGKGKGEEKPKAKPKAKSKNVK